MRSLVASSLVLGSSLLATSASATTLYPDNARHSPMTAEIVEHLSAVLAKGGGRRDVFVKIGDSITAHRGFLGCFARADEVDLGDHAALKATWDFFSQTEVDGAHLSWDRKSRAAAVGWSTFAAIGHPAKSPLHEEIRALRPSLAIVMMGTNETYGGGVANYERNLRRLVQAVLDEGVVPIVSTIPPRRDSRDLDAIVAQMNAVVREIAESERVPLVDYGAELRKLPGFGLGFDGIHPAVADKRPCALSDDALTGGLNLRNLVTLEALDRARRFLFLREAPETIDPI